MSKAIWAGLNIKALGGGFWRMVCSYNCRERSGRDGGVTVATLKNSSPFQAIEKKQLKSVPMRMLTRPFGDAAGIWQKQETLGQSRPPTARSPGEHFNGMSCI
jgi:hypothetical protein